MNINKILNYKKKRFWAGLLLVQFFLFYVLSKSKIAIHFFDQLFERKKYVHQYLASQIPFSIGDLLYIFLGGILLYQIIALFNKEKRRKAALLLFIILNLFYFTYQICWGMLYFQKTLLSKLSTEKISITEAKDLSEKFLSTCIKDRENVLEDHKGVFMIKDMNLIKNEILKNQILLPKKLVDKQAVEINAMKPSLYKYVMSYTGISGYYNPFTAEAQYNDALPATYLPFTLAHESSHQLGYAREQEANFVGFLIGENAKDADLKYSTDLFALKSLLRYIQSEDPKFVKEKLYAFSAGMKRDQYAEKIFEENHQGILDRIFAITNNLFLKSNQQEGSITYSYFTEILIKYERKIK